MYAGSDHFRLTIQPNIMTSNDPEEKKITIFHADNHWLFRSRIKTGLSKWPEIVIAREASNGKELLEFLEEEIPDLVILNITMPVMNGLETMPKIREKYPNLKVIILSMHTDFSIIKRMMELGANSFLTKNIDAKDIYRAIKCVLEYDYYYSEPIELSFLGPRPRFGRMGKVYTEKEEKIIKLLKENKSELEIAQIMDLSESTVTWIIDRLPAQKFMGESGLDSIK